MGRPPGEGLRLPPVSPGLSFRESPQRSQAQVLWPIMEVAMTRLRVIVSIIVLTLYILLYPAPAHSQSSVPSEGAQTVGAVIAG